MRNACKKAVWSGAALLCSLLVLSSSGQSEVYSVNVVGFQKVSARSNGLSMVSVPFSKQSNTLDDVIGNQLTANKSSGLADQIQLWDPVAQTYNTYYLWTNGLWYTLAGVRATNTAITTQVGMFVRNRRTTNQVVVVSGDVPEGDTATNLIVQGLNLVSYPFSTDVDVNKCNLTNGKPSKSSGTADQIQLWDSANQKYDTYYLWTNRQWYTLTGTLATNVRVGAGRGFWYRRNSTTNYSWVESRPYTF